ncbi:MAG: Deoxyuridine 5'-triphosphate nucleotidohydrolase [Firmicutes bacterium ADurb.Bin193]|nr:MAG: Deoxyuridine 5'-triphosphate nucleotidohydrolase [Firmicutes bacterium ADurb.Bin193]
MKLKIKALSEKIGRDIPYPFYATEGSAGMDLAACIDTPLTVKPGERVAVPTGIAVGLPSSEYVGLVFARSSLGLKKGITLPNAVGVIDSDYRGEILVAITNISREDYTINPGERIAQLVIMPVCVAQIEITNELEHTQRGGGGFGSTGK